MPTFLGVAGRGRNQLCYLTGLFFVQHLWYGILKHFLVAMLWKDWARYMTMVMLSQNIIINRLDNYTKMINYHSNVSFPQKLHNVNNPVKEIRVSVM